MAITRGLVSGGHTDRAVLASILVLLEVQTGDSIAHISSKKLKNKQKHWTFLQAWVGMLSFAFHLLELRKQEEAALIKKRRVGKLLHSEERVFVCSSFLPIHTNFIGLHDTA